MGLVEEEGMGMEEEGMGMEEEGMGMGVGEMEREVGEKGMGVGETVRVMEEEGMEEVGVGMGGSTSRGIFDFRNQSKRHCLLLGSFQSWQWLQMCRMAPLPARRRFQ
jgi:hypothetical protein